MRRSSARIVSLLMPRRCAVHCNSSNRYEHWGSLQCNISVTIPDYVRVQEAVSLELYQRAHLHLGQHGVGGGHEVGRHLQGRQHRRQLWSQLPHQPLPCTRNQTSSATEPLRTVRHLAMFLATLRLRKADMWKAARNHAPLPARGTFKRPVEYSGVRGSLAHQRRSRSASCRSR